MHLFDNDIAVNPAGQSPGAGTGQISGNWSINNLPNGGYLRTVGQYPKTAGHPVAEMLFSNQFCYLRSAGRRRADLG